MVKNIRKYIIVFILSLMVMNFNINGVKASMLVPDNTTGSGQYKINANIGSGGYYPGYVGFKVGIYSYSDRTIKKSLIFFNTNVKEILTSNVGKNIFIRYSKLVKPFDNLDATKTWVKYTYKSSGGEFQIQNGYYYDKIPYTWYENNSPAFNPYEWLDDNLLNMLKSKGIDYGSEISLDGCSGGSWCTYTITENDRIIVEPMIAMSDDEKNYTFGSLYEISNVFRQGSIETAYCKGASHTYDYCYNDIFTNTYHNRLHLYDELDSNTGLKDKISYSQYNSYTSMDCLQSKTCGGGIGVWKFGDSATTIETGCGSYFKSKYKGYTNIEGLVNTTYYINIKFDSTKKTYKTGGVGYDAKPDYAECKGSNPPVQPPSNTPGTITIYKYDADDKTKYDINKATFRLYANEQDSKNKTNSIGNCSAPVGGSCTIEVKQAATYYVCEDEPPKGYSEAKQQCQTVKIDYNNSTSGATTGTSTSPITRVSATTKDSGCGSYFKSKYKGYTNIGNLVDTTYYTNIQIDSNKKTYKTNGVGYNSEPNSSKCISSTTTKDSGCGSYFKKQYSDYTNIGNLVDTTYYTNIQIDSNKKTYKTNGVGYNSEPNSSKCKSGNNPPSQPPGSSTGPSVTTQLGTGTVEFYNSKTCESELKALSKPYDMSELYRLYSIYKDEDGNDLNGLLNTKNPQCTNITCNRYSQTSCLSGKYGGSYYNFNENNFICYNEMITDSSGKPIFCLNTVNLSNALGRTSFETKTGRMPIQFISSHAAVIGTLESKCYYLNGRLYSDRDISQYLPSVSFNNSNLKTDPENVSCTGSTCSVDYMLDKVYAKNGNGEIVVGDINDSIKNNYKFLGYGVVSKFNVTSPYTIPYRVEFNTSSANMLRIDRQSFTATCDVTPSEELMPKLNLEFREIDTTNPFPGKSGNNRIVGTNWRSRAVNYDDDFQKRIENYINTYGEWVFSNDNNYDVNKDGKVNNEDLKIARWIAVEYPESKNVFSINSDNSLIAYVMKARNNSFNQTKEGPIYSIKLTSTTIKAIQDYNKNNPYDDYNLSCQNGENCISNFLKDLKDGKIGGSSVPDKLIKK